MADQNTHYVTPEEAKDKCCPLSMIGNIQGVWKSCLGKHCMMWRWQEIAEDLVQLKANGDVQPVGRKVLGYSTTHGYCGMVRS